MIIVGIVLAGALIGLFLLGLLYSSFYIKSPPDIATILTGGRSGIRIIRGGAALRRPIVERIDRLSISPFEMQITVEKAYSFQGVPVNVEATALIRYGSTDEAIRTAAERFLSSRREDVEVTVREILTGHVRSIVAKMTVEQLNSSREELVKQVISEAGTDFGRLGMELDVLTIKHISDEVGYLDALGQAQTAAVKRDATIGQAEADRDAQIKSAAARQAGAVAQAAAEAAIAEANRDRDVRIAQATASVQQENARAEQSGPLASAEAKKAVVAAEVAVKEQEQRANIEVERQRVEREKQAREADVVVPARAQQEAAILSSEGEKQAAINRAEGERQRLSQEGEGQSAARLALAKATQAELIAQAEGTKAQLLAEAEGKDRLAQALNNYDEAAMRLELTPKLFNELPAIVQAAASPLGNVDRIVLIDNGSDGSSSSLGKLVGQVPGSIAAGLETLRALGIDLSSLMTVRKQDNGSKNGTKQTTDGTNSGAPH